jgi:hypothetical protein
VLRLIEEQIEPEGKHGGDHRSSEQVDSINLKTKGGTSALYTLKRLKRDRPVHLLHARPSSSATRS